MFSGGQQSYMSFTDEKPSMIGDEEINTDEWAKDIKRDFKISAVEQMDTYMLLSNMNTMYLILVGLTDICYKN